MHEIISWLYEFPIYCWLVLVLILLLLWTLSAVRFQNSSVWQTLTVIAFVISIVLIVMVTLVYRQTGGDKGFSMIPFSSFEIARIHSDVYQEVMLNVVLFFPVGLTMPFVINRITDHPVIITIISSCILSVLIEIFQYLFNRGYAEIDDVIFNALGVVVGSVSFLVYKRFFQK